MSKRHPPCSSCNHRTALLDLTTNRADYYWSIIENHIIRGNGLTAVKSKIGYLLSGPMRHCNTSDTPSTSLHTNFVDTTDYDLQRFWMIKYTGTSSVSESPDSTSLIQLYIDSHISRLPDGTDTVKFPWKPDHPALPTNFTLCERRTLSLINKLSQSGLLTTYDNILNE